MRKAIIQWVVLVLLLSAFSVVLLPLANADWTMFHANPSRSGAGTGSPVLAPTLLWKRNIGHQVCSSPAVVGGVVYIGSGNGNFYALSASSGVQLWNYKTGGYISSSPAIINGIVYFGSNDHNVYALNAANGVLIWNYTTDWVVLSSPAVLDGVVYIGSSDGNFYALNASNGTKLWNASLKVESSPAVANGVVYVSSYDGNVYALNSTDGVQLWNYATGGGYSSPAVVDGVVYIGSKNGYVNALNASNGTHIWQFTTYGTIDSSPAVVGGVVYVGSRDCNVYALNASSGAKIWNYTTGPNYTFHIPMYWVLSSPAVAGGVVYFGCDDGYVYALDAANGTKLWRYDDGGTSGSWGVSSPAIVNDVVYIGSVDGNVYALGVSSAPSLKPTPSPAATPISNSSATSVLATTESGKTVELAIRGNITSSQISNVLIASNESNLSTKASFTVTGPSSTTGFGNITIPKNVVTYGTTPLVYIDSQPAQNQGYIQDSSNYFVWYTTEFSTHQISIIFTTANSQTVAQPSLPQEIIEVAAAVIILAVVVAALKIKIRDKPPNIN